MRLPFSSFVNNLIITLNRATGQLNPIGGWLNVTIFEVACKIAGVEPSVSLFSALFNITHENFQNTFRARCNKNILAGKRPNKVPDKRLFKKWFFARWDMAVGVPHIWTLKDEVKPLPSYTDADVIVADKSLSTLHQEIERHSQPALVYFCQRGHIGVSGSCL
ncbi:hypothetical protein LIER_01082 [Lithospermum erythrorhizon]|uniref:Transposase (putative) gypsy type domain-containing protein n=1 Tax=Lithospermum erythrorhizon TaxID=34254 RepID=A0AAV3NK71_LITER